MFKLIEKNLWTQDDISSCHFSDSNQTVNENIGISQCIIFFNKMNCISLQNMQY